MKAPTHCPKCGDALVNDFYERKSLNIIIKRCKTRPDHQFQCVVGENDTDMYSATVAVSVNPLIRVAWRFDEKTLAVAKGTIEEMIKRGDDEEFLPFFMPNFKDYNKLIKKLRTYITFS